MYEEELRKSYAQAKLEALTELEAKLREAEDEKFRALINSAETAEEMAKRIRGGQ